VRTLDATFKKISDVTSSAVERSNSRLTQYFTIRG